MNNAINEPRLRINRTTSLTLSTSWQDVVFNGTSPYNVNTYGKEPTTGNPMVYYDSVTNLIRFYEQYDKNFNITLYLSTLATLISTRATLQYRFVIPNGISTGVDFYFPFPDSNSWTDIGEVTITAAQINHAAESIPLYLTNNIRNNGIKLQLRLSNSLITLGTASLTTAILLIQ